MLSTSRSRSSGRATELHAQVVVPMSERQQLALVMQISTKDALPVAVAPTSPSPPKEKKRSKNHRSHRGAGTLHMSTLRSNHRKKKLKSKSSVYIDNFRAPHAGRARDDSSKKGGNATAHSDSNKRNNMDGLAQGEHFDSKDTGAQEKGSAAENRDDGAQLSSGVVSSTQDETGSSSKKQYTDDSHETEAPDDEGSKRKKRKENDDKEPMAKPAPVARGGTGRVLTGSKHPGPASKTGGSSLSKSASQGSSKGPSSGKGQQAQGKGSAGGKGKSSGSKSASSQAKQDRKSPVASPKPHSGKDNADDSEEPKSESAAPKVPPLKIVIPGGASGAGNRNEQEGSSGQRGSGKGRGSVSTLPYVIPCTSNDAGQTSDSSDGNCEDKRSGEGKAGQRVLRSHRTNDGDKEKDKERTSPQTGSDSRSGSGQNQSALNSNKSPTPSGSGQDADHSSGTGRSESNTGGSVDLHPRKRKIKASKDSHSRDSSKNDPTPDSTTSHNITHSNPYQMYIHIRKQIEQRQKSLFPVKPKPPKDFNKYLMNRCTYTLQSNLNPEPQIEIPPNLPQQMVNEFISQEKERTRLRIQHLVEKEKLVLAVEQEILRVHGRAERAVANQALPFSVCTMLRDNEVYNVLAPEQEEKRNAQRSRCNGRQINSWLQEVDDKWEKIKSLTSGSQQVIQDDPWTPSLASSKQIKETEEIPEDEGWQEAEGVLCPTPKAMPHKYISKKSKPKQKKVGMLRRQHTEVETLHAVQMMGWEWKLKELGLCDYKTSPKIDTAHVPQIHVSNFDLPA